MCGVYSGTFISGVVKIGRQVEMLELGYTDGRKYANASIILGNAE